MSWIIDIKISTPRLCLLVAKRKREYLIIYYQCGIATYVVIIYSSIIFWHPNGVWYAAAVPVDLLVLLK